MKKIFFLIIAIMFPMVASAQQFIPFLKWTNATGTSATTTNLFSTTASSSNLFTANFQGAGLSTCTGTNALTYSGGLFSCTAQPQGTVTAVSVASANGFSGSSSGGATPALTLTTTITGVLKGNGTAISAAANGTDYTLISATTCSGSDKVSAISASGAVTCSTDQTGAGGGGGGVGFASSTDAYFNNQSIYMYGQGYTGFGTSTPRWLVQIASSTAPQLTFTDPNAPLNGKHWIHRVVGGNMYIGTSSDDFLSTSTALTIMGTSGNVGIGSTSPFAKLTVDNAGANIINPVLVLKQQTGGTGNVFEVRDSSNALYFFVNSFGNGQSNQGWNFQGSAGTAPASGAIIVQATAAANNAVTIKQTVGTNYTGDFLRVLRNDNSAIATLTSGGNFIVGTNTTPYRLAIQGNIGSTTDLFVISTTTSPAYATSSLFKVSYLGEASTTSMVISSTGGSGATTCLQASATGLVSSTGSACGGAGSTPGGSDTQIQYNNGGSFGGATSFVWNGTRGAAGLGTTTPNTLLTLSSSTAPQLLFTDGSLTATQYFIRNVADKLWFGSSTPATGATTTQAGLVLDLKAGTPSFQVGDSPVAITYLNSGTSTHLTQEMGTQYTDIDPGVVTGQSIQLSGSCVNGTPQGLVYGETGNATTSVFIGGKCGPRNNVGVITTGVLVGVGTTSPAGALEIASASSSQLILSPTTPLSGFKWHFRSAGNSLYISTSTNTDWGYATSSMPAVTINANGYMGLATTSPWRTLSVNGSVAFAGLTSSGTGNAVCISTGKEILDAGGGTCTPSSIQFKENLKPLPSNYGLDTINKLNLVFYDYKDKQPHETNKSLGVIAEEVEKLGLKDFVDYDYQGNVWGVHYEKFIMLNTKAIQELAKDNNWQWIVILLMLMWIARLEIKLRK